MSVSSFASSQLFNGEFAAVAVAGFASVCLFSSAEQLRSSAIMSQVQLQSVALASVAASQLFS